MRGTPQGLQKLLGHKSDSGRSRSLCGATPLKLPLPIGHIITEQSDVSDSRCMIYQFAMDRSCAPTLILAWDTDSLLAYANFYFL